MSHLLASFIAGLSAAALIGPATAAAQQSYPGGPSQDPRCRAVVELPDGSWRLKHAVTFGRSTRIEAGATIYKGEVVGGVDVGAVLQRECRDFTQNWDPGPVDLRGTN